MSKIEDKKNDKDGNDNWEKDDFIREGYWDDLVNLIRKSPKLPKADRSKDPPPPI